MKYSAFVCLTTALLFSSAALAEKEKPIALACSEAKIELVSASYGLSAPDGWQCKVMLRKSKPSYQLILWEKGKKQVMLFSDNLADYPIPEEEAKQLPGYGDEEPRSHIRQRLEAFFNDPKVTGQNEGRKELSGYYRKFVKGIMFSKSNKITAVYESSGSPPDGTDIVVHQQVSFFKEGGGKAFLNVGFKRCSTDDAFNLVINPVIQN